MNIPMGRSRKTAVLADTVLHYRLAGTEKETFNSWLSHRELKHFESGIALVELMAKLDERPQFVLAALRFSKDTTIFCLPGPDSYVSAWVSAALGIKSEAYTRWDTLRDEILVGAGREREQEIIGACTAILVGADAFVRVMGQKSSNMSKVILDSFPGLRDVFPNGMTKNEVLKSFRIVAEGVEFQTIIAEQLLRWLWIPDARLALLRKSKPLMEIDRVKILTRFFIEWWKDYLGGLNPDPNDREDFLLLTYAPAVKHILTGDKRFADRAAKACAGTIFQDLVVYVGVKFDLS